MHTIGNVLAAAGEVTDAEGLKTSIIAEFGKNAAIALAVGAAGVAAGFGVNALWVARRAGKKAMNGIGS